MWGGPESPTTATVENSGGQPSGTLKPTSGSTSGAGSRPGASGSAVALGSPSGPPGSSPATGRVPSGASANRAQGSAGGTAPRIPNIAGLGSAGASPLGLGSSGTSTPGLMIGVDSESGAQKAGGGASTDSSNGEKGEPPLFPPREAPPTPAIEIPFEIVVACNADGVTIQPGGYRITNQALRGRKSEDLLIRNLTAVSQKRAEVDPAIRPRPRVKFLVENDGAPNFWEARRQVLFSGLNWPMTLQVAGVQNPRLLEEGAW